MKLSDILKESVVLNEADNVNSASFIKDILTTLKHWQKKFDFLDVKFDTKKENVEVWKPEGSRPAKSRILKGQLDTFNISCLANKVKFTIKVLSGKRCAIDVRLDGMSAKDIDKYYSMGKTDSNLTIVANFITAIRNEIGGKMTIDNFDKDSYHSYCKDLTPFESRTFGWFAYKGYKTLVGEYK